MHYASASHHAADASPFSSPLLRNLVLFGRLLRAVGVKIPTGALSDLATSTRWIDIRSREDFREAARCLLVSRHEDMELFDRAFDLFWRSWKEQGGDLLERALDELPLEQTPSDHPPAGSRRAGSADLSLGAIGVAESEEDDEEGAPSPLPVYSASEALRSKDFALYSQDELIDAQRFLESMQWAIVRRRSLRTRPARQGRRLDVRRSVRQNLRHGGELLNLAYRGPKMKRRPVVLLCDISGSMDRYTRLLLHFLHSIETSAQRTEIFVFGTRLTRITQALKHRNPDEAIAAASVEVQDWSGGTRIGESLHAFNQSWARRVLGHGAIVIIISDGWDRGDPAVLSREMERLQRASYRLLWLNPLLGSRNYRPLTQGIQAALPYIDDFLPVHNLASLEALARLLNDVQEGRPNRKQARHTSIPLENGIDLCATSS